MKETTSKKGSESIKDLTQSWINSVVNAGHDLLWPSGVAPTTGPTLLTGVKMSNSDYLIDHLMEWERKFESADLEKHKRFLRGKQLSVRDIIHWRPQHGRLGMFQKLMVYLLISLNSESRD